MSRIYLDWAATAPLLPEAREAMIPWLSATGNASSLHAEGRAARDAIDQAREVLSAKLGCEFGEIVFTSSGTESANLAIVGTALANLASPRRRILFSAVEHHCVLNTGPLLEKLGFKVELIPVDREGIIDLEWLERAIDDDVVLVSVMHANNETGAKQPVGEVASTARSHGALLHLDAVQTFCALPWSVKNLAADYVSISGHKIGGPQGVGALHVRAGIKPQPILVGGGQEREMRAGTENVAAIAGFGASVRNHPSSSHQAPEAATRFRAELVKHTNAQFTVSDQAPVLDNFVHCRFPGAGAESMLIVLDRLGVSASSGSACSSGSIEPSHVLLAMGIPEEHAKESLRFTFGHTVTIDESIDAAGRVADAVDQVRRKAPASR